MKNEIVLALIEMAKWVAGAIKWTGISFIVLGFIFSISLVICSLSSRAKESLNRLRVSIISNLSI